MYSFVKKSVKRAFWRMLETKIKIRPKFLQKSVDKRRSVWYYSQARWGNGQESPEEQRGTHLENYIVQDQKNKQVIQETVKQVGRTCEAENESF